MDEDIAQVLLKPDEIAERVAELGAQITQDYAGQELVVVCQMNSALFFFSDLVRAINLPVVMEYINVDNLGGATRSTGAVRFTRDLRENIDGRHVLLVTGVIHSGLVQRTLLKHLQAQRPASLELCAFLSKPSTRKVDVSIKYCAFDLPDSFVVGYGLDYHNKYRHLPFIGLLKDELFLQ